ncbi:transposase [Mesorhizobium sp. M0046]|uniref:transposase n=1 Tax=Mesorhizobium sp. M0046 TaxID=2956858 RepID=UPI00333AC61D
MLAYLGRHTHRVAIANSRLISTADNRVAFCWRDYRHRGKTKVMTLHACEFIRRFLLHTLADGFHRIRHYGFLAHGNRAAKLDLCRRLLAGSKQNGLEPDAESAAVVAERLAVAHRCPSCGEPIITLAIWRCGQAPPSPFLNDTS